MYKYRTVEQSYGEQQRVIFPNYLNGYTIRNEGTTLLVINNTADMLLPGESKSVGGNVGELFDGQLNISFQVQTPAPAIISNIAVVSMKYYTAILMIGHNSKTEIPLL